MIIVTGAKGFIGSAVIWELERAGKGPIVAVDLHKKGERTEYFKSHSISGDLTEKELISQLENGQLKPEWIVHMGACSSTTEMNRDYLREINTEYTQKLWNHCAKEQIPFIYASSGAVYGDGAEGFDDKTDPETFKPLNPYGESKLNFDIWTKTASNFPPQWYGLRFFNVYGPNEYHKGDMSSVVFKAFEQITSQGSLKLFRSHNKDYKDGEQLRDFVYIKDITRWILELIDTQPQSGIYNMGYGEARSWLDLAKATFLALNKEMKIDWIDIPERIRDKYQYYTQAKMDSLFSLGLSQPEWPLEKGIKDYVTNYLSQDLKSL